MKLDHSERFLKSLPTQLRLWSPTSLASYMACPQRYFLRYVEGWKEGVAGHGGSIDLEFGDYVHQAHDVYMKALASGSSPEEATEHAVEHALRVTWPEGEDPWGGVYRRVWRCSGKVMGTKGRKVNCPNSKQWNPMGGGFEACSTGQCRSCGDGYQSEVVYFPIDRTKNRHTLIRSVIALCDALSTSMLRPVTLPDGRIGSELEFARELPLLSPDGTPYFMIGSFDGLSSIGDGEEWALPEIKTTRKNPDQKWFSQFESSVQIYTYTWSAYLEFPNKRPRVYLTVVHLGVGFTNVFLHPLRVPPEVLEEWEGDMVEWIKRAELDAVQYQLDQATAYPRNRTACHGLPGAPTTACPFLGICRLSPLDREPFLKSNFHRRPTDTVAVQGVSETDAGDLEDSSRD